MITFLVTSDLVLNARLLDNARLGKQRLEALQVLELLLGKSSKNRLAHPTYKMWCSVEKQLAITTLQYYINCLITEWLARGFKNTMTSYDVAKPEVLPWFVTWTRLHQSHRAMLVRKNPSWYKPLFVGELDIEPEYFLYGYIWPTVYTEEPLSVIASPIPEILVKPRYCSKILKSGKRKGSACNTIIKRGNYCGRHSK